MNLEFGASGGHFHHLWLYMQNAVNSIYVRVVTIQSMYTCTTLHITFRRLSYDINTANINLPTQIPIYCL
jgi:hypothetical protein